VTPARVVRPQGARPETHRTEYDPSSSRVYTKEIPKHRPGCFCSVTVCKPEPCKRCVGGWVHKIVEEGIRLCGGCGRQS
jgi:hypothetical protein